MQRHYNLFSIQKLSHPESENVFCRTSPQILKTLKENENITNSQASEKVHQVISQIHLEPEIVQTLGSHE